MMKIIDLLTNFLKKFLAFIFLQFVLPIFIVGYKFYEWLVLDRRFDTENKPFFQFKTPGKILFSILGTTFVVFLSTYFTVLLRYVIGWASSGFAPILTVQNFNEFLQVKLNFVPYDWNSFSLSNFRYLSIAFSAPLVFLVFFVLFGSVFVRLFIRVARERQDFNHNEQGDDKLITDKQLKKTYKQIPNRGKAFPGYGGVPIGHFLNPVPTPSVNALRAKMMYHFPRYDDGDKKTMLMSFTEKFGKTITSSEKVLGLTKKPSGTYLIEDGTVNSLLTGMTRSGKGETFVNVLVDNLSRAKKKSSMVIADPKGELFQMAYKTLVKRNYNVQVLNFQNTDFSMSYNPLALAIDYAKKGYYEKVQDQVHSVSSALFKQAKSTDGSAKFWDDSSINLFDALVLAIMWRASITDEWETVTIRNMIESLNQLGSEYIYEDGTGTVFDAPLPDGSTVKKSKITSYFDRLGEVNRIQPNEFLSMADNAFRQSNFAGEETKGSIFSSMLSGVSLYVNNNIAKMTSKNSIDLTAVGFPRKLSIKLRMSSDVSQGNPFANQTAFLTISAHGKSLINQKTVLIDSMGYLNYQIEPLLPNIFSIEITFNHVNNYNREIINEKLLILVTKKYGKIKEIKIQKKTENILIEAKDIEMVYSEKATAIFLVVPPNKSAYDGMVSQFIDQLFSANFEMASDGGRKTISRIHFIIDEFGNYPAIPEMSKNISIGLGVNILFDLVVQNLEQIDAKYGKEDAQTIISNCSFNEFIKSTSEETARKYEVLSGKQTITTRSKTISYDANAHVSGSSVNFQQIPQPLLTATQLLKLRAGEAFISIGVKAETILGQKTENIPILAKGKTEFPYRYMFLFDEFDQSTTLSDIPVKSKHRGLNLAEIAIDNQKAFDAISAYKDIIKYNPENLEEAIRMLKRDE